MTRGVQRERQVRRILEEDGWWTCRAAGSLGDADVLALKYGRVPRLVEVKSTHRGPYHGFGPADRADLKAAAKDAGAEAWLAWWPPRGRLQWFPSWQWPKEREAA